MNQHAICKRNLKAGRLPLNPGTESQVDGVVQLLGIHPNDLREFAHSNTQFDQNDSSFSTFLIGGLFHSRRTDIDIRAQSLRLANNATQRSSRNCADPAHQMLRKTAIDC
jgi:hypothetical protein